MASRLGVLIKPEIIVFSLSGEAGSARDVFKCKVNKINTIGSSVRIEVGCGIPHKIADHHEPCIS